MSKLKSRRCRRSRQMPATAASASRCDASYAAASIVCHCSAAAAETALPGAVTHVHGRAMAWLQVVDSYSAHTWERHFALVRLWALAGSAGRGRSIFSPNAIVASGMAGWLRRRPESEGPASWAASAGSHFSERTGAPSFFASVIFLPEVTEGTEKKVRPQNTELGVPDGALRRGPRLKRGVA